MNTISIKVSSYIYINKFIVTILVVLQVCLCFSVEEEVGFSKKMLYYKFS